ncbi:MAG: SMC-Scp complex subunit ScpB [Armatimonadota bacterium]|nr:SMC-Scp complex subunit ScpB [Armatimonadota bacterium]
MTNQEGIVPNGKLKNILECMLFVSPQPLVVKQVAQSLELDEAEIEKAIHELRLDYNGRGLQIVRIAGGYQMCTRPEYADDIAKLLKPERVRLSRAALETVAIIAYRQPITAPEIEAIRGVNSDGVLHTLLERGLVKQVGRKETVGRPILYATTEEFLNHFGLNDLSELPELEDVEFPEPTQGESR